jgi:predicted Zn-dependent protease
VRLLAARSAVSAGKPLDAVTTLEKLVQDLPRNAALRNELARAYVAAGRMTDADNANAEALRLDPGDWSALAFAANRAIQAGSLDAAEATLGRMRGPEVPTAVLASLEGDLAMRRKAYGEAVEHYAAARQRGDTARLALSEYAARREAKADDPTEPLRQWLERVPDDASMRFAYAAALQTTGEGAKAEEQYERVLRARPAHTATLNNLAMLRLEKGNTAAALDLARRAYDSNPAVPAVADTYGWVLLQSGRTAEALPLLRGAYARDQANGEVRYHLAAALAASGMKAEAREHLEALATNGSGLTSTAQAKQLLTQLRGG